MLGVVCGAAHAFVSAPDTDTAAFAAGHHGGRTADGAKAQTDPASRRLALVIGNAAYAGDPLANPVKDARAFDEALRGLGFEVMRIENATRERMEEAIVEFQRRIEAGGVALFYYAGHGFQVADKTLLAAVDTDSRIPVRMLTRSMELRSVIQAMAKPRPGRLNLVILDTCLNNPFGTGVGRLPDTPEDTLIAYSTAPDSTAADRDRNGLNGLYTAHLLNALSVPGRELREIFERVESGVRHASAQRQIPWVASSLSGEFRFAAAGQTIRNRPAPAPVLSQEDRLTEQEARHRGVLPKDSNEQYELTFWESIKDSTHVGDYEAYLQTYPNGRFAGLAKARIERLRAAAPKTEAPKTEAPKTEAPKAEVPKAAPAPDAARQAPAAKPAETARPAPAPKSPRARPATPPAAKEAAPEPASPAASVPQSAEKASGQPVGRGEIKDCPTCPVLISLSPGSFVMGSNVGDPSEKPPHQVAIKAPFAIGKFEVTVEQWNACVSAGGCARIGSDGMPSAKNAPVRDVSWDDAQQYVKWISKTTGHAYRLPTEAEWEYAAKGGTSTRYWWGEQMRPGNANCKDCGGEWNKDAPAEIGSFPANPYGLHDVNGSVWEWVSDCWHNSYKGAPADGKTWDAPNCRVRVIRGGSWREGSAYMMSSTRFKYDASVRHSQNGFRVVRDLK